MRYRAEPYCRDAETGWRIVDPRGNLMPLVALTEDAATYVASWLNEKLDPELLNGLCDDLK